MEFTYAQKSIQLKGFWKSRNLSGFMLSVKTLCRSSSGLTVSIYCTGYSLMNLTRLRTSRWRQTTLIIEGLWGQFLRDDAQMNGGDTVMYCDPLQSYLIAIPIPCDSYQYQHQSPNAMQRYQLVYLFRITNLAVFNLLFFPSDISCQQFPTFYMTTIRGGFHARKDIHLN